MPFSIDSENNDRMLVELDNAARLVREGDIQGLSLVMLKDGNITACHWLLGQVPDDLVPSMLRAVAEDLEQRLAAGLGPDTKPEDMQ